MYKFGHVDRQMTVQYAAEDRVVLSSEGLRSTISSEDGDCGSIYLLDEPSVARKVCGFHFAGMSGKAFSDFKSLGTNLVGGVPIEHLNNSFAFARVIITNGIIKNVPIPHITHIPKFI